MIWNYISSFLLPAQTDACTIRRTPKSPVAGAFIIFSNCTNPKEQH
jgi:hypothetical protein